MGEEDCRPKETGGKVIRREYRLVLPNSSNIIRWGLYPVQLVSVLFEQLHDAAPPN